MEAKSYLISKTEAVQFVLPQHLNHMGNMHGGEIMKLMDNTAGLTFMRHAEGIAVTAAVNDLKLIKPIADKEVIKCTAEVIATGRSSMEILVEVFIEELETGKTEKAAEGIFVGVAIDENGKSRPVPPVKIETERQRQRLEEKKKAHC